MTSEETPVGRRNVLRGGAIVAGVAAGAVIAGAQTRTAEAAVGDPVTVGGDFTAANQATTLRITGSTQTPALRLVNPTGPALRLDPTTNGVGTLAVGDLAGDAAGPLVGVDDGNGGSYTTYLATGVDLAFLAVPVAQAPTRVLDTRSTAGRALILDTSPHAFDASFRLTAGAWVDVAIDSASQDYAVDAAFVNVTVTGPQANGFVTAYPPGNRPLGSTINYVKGQTLANGAFVGVGLVQDSFAVRFYTTSVTHLIVDLTGKTLLGVPGPAAQGSEARKLARTSVRTRPAARRLRLMGRSRR